MDRRTVGSKNPGCCREVAVSVLFLSRGRARGLGTGCIDCRCILGVFGDVMTFRAKSSELEVGLATIISKKSSRHLKKVNYNRILGYIIEW